MTMLKNTKLNTRVDSCKATLSKFYSTPHNAKDLFVYSQFHNMNQSINQLKSFYLVSSGVKIQILENNKIHTLTIICLMFKIKVRSNTIIKAKVTIYYILVIELVPSDQ